MHEKNAPSEPPARFVGYARVSTSGLTLEAQIEQLTVAGCRPIFRKPRQGRRPIARSWRSCYTSYSQAT